MDCAKEGKRSRTCRKTQKTQEICGKITTTIVPGSLNCDCMSDDDYKADPYPVQDRYRVTDENYDEYNNMENNCAALPNPDLIMDPYVFNNYNTSSTSPSHGVSTGIVNAGMAGIAAYLLLTALPPVGLPF